MTLSVADTTSSPSAATPSQPDLEESLNLNSVKKMPASKVVNVEVHDESFSNFVRKDRKDLDESAIVTSPEITKVTNTSQDAIGEFIKLTSVPKKRIPSTVVMHYCAWYSFFWNRC